MGSSFSARFALVLWDAVVAHLDISVSIIARHAKQLFLQQLCCCVELIIYRAGRENVSEAIESRFANVQFRILGAFKYISLSEVSEAYAFAPSGGHFGLCVVHIKNINQNRKPKTKNKKNRNRNR